MSPARLQKKQEPKGVLEIYAPYILITCIIILVLLIICLILTFAHVHANSLVGSEANVYQNLEAII